MHSTYNSASEERDATDDRRAEYIALQRLDEASVRLQEEGRYDEALETMERGLVLRQHMFGADSDEVWSACATVGELCNMLAMSALQRDDLALVLELLKKAEVLTERDAAGRAVTYNNLACYYRRRGKPHAALRFLQRALRIESRLPECDNPHDTHLNVCAVLSQLGRHKEALRHAQAAMSILQERLFGGGGGGGGAAAARPERVSSLAIAYHNLGVEHEFLRDASKAVAAYSQGLEVANVYLGEGHSISRTLASSLEAARYEEHQQHMKQLLRRGGAPSKSTSQLEPSKSQTRSKSKRTSASTAAFPKQPPQSIPRPTSRKQTTQTQSSEPLITENPNKRVPEEVDEVDDEEEYSRPNSPVAEEPSFVEGAAAMAPMELDGEDEAMEEEEEDDILDDFLGEEKSVSKQVNGLGGDVVSTSASSSKQVNGLGGDVVSTSSSSSKQVSGLGGDVVSTSISSPTSKAKHPSNISTSAHPSKVDEETPSEFQRRDFQQHLPASSASTIQKHDAPMTPLNPEEQTHVLGDPVWVVVRHVLAKADEPIETVVLSFASDEYEEGPTLDTPPICSAPPLPTGPALRPCADSHVHVNIASWTTDIPLQPHIEALKNGDWIQLQADDRKDASIRFEMRIVPTTEPEPKPYQPPEDEKWPEEDAEKSEDEI